MRCCAKMCVRVPIGVFVGMHVVGGMGTWTLVAAGEGMHVHDMSLAMAHTHKLWSKQHHALTQDRRSCLERKQAAHRLGPTSLPLTKVGPQT